MKTPSTDLYSETYNDIYFCEEDGLAEGYHVFLNGNGLPEGFPRQKNFVIAETGFGTGLNFLASWMAFDGAANADQHLTYISFEKFPLSKQQIHDTLSRWSDQLGGRLEKMLDVYPIRAGGWHPIRVADNVTLLLIFDDVNRALPQLNAQVDAWFLDGFAPAKNPEMWSETVFAAMAKNSHAGTTVASFTAAGLVKRCLRDQGFFIAKRRGYGRKRDMIYGHFEGVNEKPTKPAPKRVAVIGGGLAGTSIANRLHEEGMAVDLFEEQQIAAGASGNSRGLFNPRFTSTRNAVSEFYASAYSLALRRFKSFDDIDYKQVGSLHLVTDADKEKRLRGALATWNWHEDHMQILDETQASAMAGVTLSQGALYLADAGFVGPEKLCHALSKDVRVIHQKIETIDRASYDAVVIACGMGAKDIAKTAHLPLGTVRGQIAYAKSSAQTETLKANICYGGYCSVAHDGFHAIGATFQPWLNDTDVKDSDRDEIIGNLEKNIPSIAGQWDVTGGRAALRVATKDRFPIIGALPHEDGVYVSLGHGSHGLISALLGAEIITAQILGRTQPVPDEVLTALSAQRFADRDAKRAS